MYNKNICRVEHCLTPLDVLLYQTVVYMEKLSCHQDATRGRRTDQVVHLG